MDLAFLNNNYTFYSNLYFKLHILICGVYIQADLSDLLFTVVKIPIASSPGQVH